MRRLAIVIRRGRQTPVFSIGIVSQLTGLPIHTLRWIERHGLIDPFRSGGNQRLFSEEDVNKVQEIRALMQKKVNLPGIRVILRLKSLDGSKRKQK